MASLTRVTVRAAGGVVLREGHIALVHRPRYDDWSLPKGKLEPGEPALVAACREVLEETGVRPVLGARLPTICYPSRGDASGEKAVDYWAMTVDTDLGFTPNSEIDEVLWLQPEQALARLSYPHDVEVVSAFTALPALAGLVVVLRHTSAGKRAAWAGADSARSLDSTGRARAQQLASMLAWFAPARLVSASPQRCIQTLAPLASTLDLPIEVVSAFDEAADPQAAADRVRALALRGDGDRVVICSQGGLIPPLLAALAGVRAEHFATAKGDGWVLSFADTGVVAADFLA